MLAGVETAFLRPAPEGLPAVARVEGDAPPAFGGDVSPSMFSSMNESFASRRLRSPSPWTPRCPVSPPRFNIPLHAHLPPLRTAKIRLKMKKCMVPGYFRTCGGRKRGINSNISKCTKTLRVYRGGFGSGRRLRGARTVVAVVGLLEPAPASRAREKIRPGCAPRCP